jgi:beta-glucosidase
LEWSKIEPEPGKFDFWAVKHYHDVIDECLKNGIEPMITLHHFTNPIWFERIGAFQNERSVFYFVRFSEFVFRQFSSKVKNWLTFNESEFYFFFGYISGEFPPGKKFNFGVGKTVLKHFLESHVETFYKLKSLPNGKESKIGFVKNIMIFDPYQKDSPTYMMTAYTMNHLLTESILKFFETGKFQFFPFITEFENPRAMKSLDFVGLNYYSHIIPKFQLSFKEPVITIARENEFKTEMNYTMYAEGFYRSLQRMKNFKVPIYITENGAPDSKDIIRKDWIARHMYSLQKAV